MKPASRKPAWLLLGVGSVLAVAVGLVGQGGRRLAREHARSSSVVEAWTAPTAEVLRTPVMPLASEPEPASAPRPREAPAAERSRASQPASLQTRLIGFVRRLDGQPASGARVVLGQQHARCDRSGRFELLFASDVGSSDLVAHEPGYEPALRPAFGAGLVRYGENEVRLVLGAETLSLSGSVRARDGRPLEGWTVELDGLDPLSTSGLRETVRTDAEGRFLLTDVPAGNHVVRAWKERRELAFRSPMIASGSSDVAIVVDP